VQPIKHVKINFVPRKFILAEPNISSVHYDTYDIFMTCSHVMI